MTGFRNPCRIALVVTACALVAATAARADGLKKGDTLLLLQLTNGDVSLASPVSGGGYISAYPQTEWGGGLQVQHLLSEDWSITFGGGIGTMKETDTPAPASLNPAFTYKQSSWNARVGADRFIHINPRTHLFTGPGLAYWSGLGKDEVSGTTTDRPRAKRIALDGRFGASIGLGDKWGLSGQIGRYVGHSTATDKASSAKASWWSSGGDGQVGLWFAL